MTTFTTPFVFPDHGHLIVETTTDDGLRGWRNSIDVAWDNSIGPPDPSDAVVTAFTDFLKGIQRNDCHLSKASLRPWSKGNLPLADQPAYWEETISIACDAYSSGTCYGGSGDNGTPTVGEICLLLKKTPFASRAFRAGNMFIRNSINLENTQYTAGGPPALKSSSAATAIAAINAWAVSKLSAHCEGASLPKYVLVHAQKTGTNTFDVFDTQTQTPVFARLTMHDVGTEVPS